MRWIAAIAVVTGIGLVRTLCWDDPNPKGAVQSFNVYWRAELDKGEWIRLTNVTTTNVAVELSGAQGFFTVTASNANGEVWMKK